jgi:predicted transcriptional regulator of viral defense system
VSSVEVTALDLASRPGDGGGLSNVATVIGELAHGVGIDSDLIVVQARHYPTSSLRRLGWLLEHVDAPVDLARLEVALGDDGAARPVVLLDPTGPRVGRSNRRWGIVENTEVETDL